jgi:hypothetical protein
MYKVHMYLNNSKLVFDGRMAHIPNNGDLVRLDHDRCVMVTELVYCMDENEHELQDAIRVNIALTE